jgi:4-carboxymuconolactone decarboxylase
VPLARAAGLTKQQIDAILETGDATGDLDEADFSPTERAALDVVTELCTTHRLRDDSFATAQAVFGDEAFTELLMIISCYYGLALVLNAADLDIDSGAQFQP